MTLDGYALTGLFVVMFGFLCLTAWIFETAQSDPISPDRRNQAHRVGDYLPLRSPVEPVTGSSVPPVRARDGMAGSIGDPRGPSVSVVPD